MSKVKQFNEFVYLRFVLYKSLFSNLPYADIKEIATFLPVFTQACNKGLAKGISPAQIVAKFLKEYQKEGLVKNSNAILFKFIQFIERQVVLFDALEDAAFSELNQINGEGTLAELFRRASVEGKETELSDKLKEFCLRPVLTAHPTQFYTGQVLAIITDLTHLFRTNDISAINALLLQLSKTPFFKKEKPSPFQEAQRLVWYLQNIFYHAIPEVNEKILSFLKSQGIQTAKLRPVEVGFWPGGDRDGNPFVTHETTLQTARHLKQTILKCYRADVKKLIRKLTFKKVDELIEQVSVRLYASIFSKGKHEYKNPAELITDLNAILKIITSEYENIYADKIKALIAKVGLFGFHFSSLDVRQNSALHRQVIQELLNKQGKLKKGFNKKLSDKANEVLSTIKTIKTIQKENGETALHRYIISNCQDVDDINAVLTLFKAANWTQPTVDIVPLFETVSDLEQAGKTMAELYQNKTYRTHLKKRGFRQTVMLGFSDGTKDGGYLTANWGIYKAKQELTKVSKDAGIQVVFFDGRGGPAARGGGKTHQFYSSMDDTIAMDEIQLTIQGQTISSNFGTIPSATYNMEQLLHAGLAGGIFLRDKNTFNEKQFAMMNQLSSDSLEAYLDLRNDSKFISYLEQFSPIKYLGMANIASRPTSRKREGKLQFEDLRAITFVGSWYQLKQNVPGFFGLGTAIKKMKSRNKLSEVKQLYRNAPFFKALIDNSMMALSKSDFSLTKSIRTDKQYGHLWKKIKKEYDLTTELLLEITGMKILMENEAVSLKSISIREELVAPLAVIQQYALAQLRKPKLPVNEQKIYKNIVIRTLYGTTNAGRNSV